MTDKDRALAHIRNTVLLTEDEWEDFLEWEAAQQVKTATDCLATQVSAPPQPG